MANLKMSAIHVIPLCGNEKSFATLEEAIVFVKEQPDIGKAGKPLVRIEVILRYIDGTDITAGFPHKARAVEFLRNRLTGVL